MSSISRVAVLTAALISALGASASSAGAVTWSSDGDTTFTASGSPSTMSITSLAGVACTGADMTGTMNASSAAAVWNAAHGTLTFTGCAIAGIATPTHCTYDLTALSGVVSGASTVALDMTCSAYEFNTKICDIAGRLTGTYTNPSATTAGRIATTTGGHLRTSAGCISGLANEPVHASPMTFTIVGGATKGPIITHA